MQKIIRRIFVLKIAIIEDHEQDHLYVKHLVQQYFLDKEIPIEICSFFSIPENKSLFEDFSLVFLDVQIGKENGIQWGKQLIAQYPDLTILITSAHPQYLIDGYSIPAARYFLKPVDPDIFSFEMDDVLARPVFSRHQGICDPRIAPYKILFSEIVYIEYLDRKTHIVLANGTRLESTIALKEWMSILKKQAFGQPYKSFLVNLCFVESILPRDVVVSKKHIPLSKHFRKSFIQAFDRANRSLS